MSRTAFTLRELLVVTGIIAILLALLLPGLQRNVPNAARRMQCSNNTKQLVLGLQNYADTFGAFPAGGQSRSSAESAQSGWGPSWIFATLPFCEQRQLYDITLQADVRNLAADDFTSAALRRVSQGADIKYLRCPSSPLPHWQNLGGVQLLTPSYAGIMGANIDAGKPPHNAADPLRRIVPGPYGGVAAGNGMLPINEWLTIRDCKDGTANVIVVSEVSDWYYNDAGRKHNPSLSIADAGEGPHNAAGWLAGTNLPFTIAGDEGPAVPANSICNLVTLEHPVGWNNKDGGKGGHPAWGTRGIGRCGLNNPLLSAHPAGAVVGFVDGHVWVLTKQTDPFVMKRLAIRDDGAEIPVDEY